MRKLAHPKDEINFLRTGTWLCYRPRCLRALLRSQEVWRIRHWVRLPTWKCPRQCSSRCPSTRLWNVSLFYWRLRSPSASRRPRNLLSSCFNLLQPLRGLCSHRASRCFGSVSGRSFLDPWLKRVPASPVLRSPHRRRVRLHWNLCLFSSRIRGLVRTSANSHFTPLSLHLHDTTSNYVKQNSPNAGSIARAFQWPSGAFLNGTPFSQRPGRVTHGSKDLCTRLQRWSPREPPCRVPCLERHTLPRYT